MPKDLKQTDTGDLDITGGDIHWIESTNQHQKDLLVGRICDFKMSPLATVEMEECLEDETPEDLHHAVRTKFAADGMQVNFVESTGENIEIDADYRNG